MKTAPATIVVAARALAQAAMLKDSAFDRLTSVGSSVSGRTRNRVFETWSESTDRCERLVRNLGPNGRTMDADQALRFSQSLVESILRNVADDTTRQRILADVRATILASPPVRHVAAELTHSAAGHSPEPQPTTQGADAPTETGD